MYGLFGLLPTSGENFMSTALLEIYLLRKMVTCSILILPAVCLKCYHYLFFFAHFKLLSCICSYNIYIQKCYPTIIDI